MGNKIKKNKIFAEINPDIYAETLMEKYVDLGNGLRYYINRTRELEVENKVLKEMYGNRVEEFLNLKKKLGE